MRREELDGNIWTLPGTRTKNHRPHVVPLCPALALIPANPGLGSPYVFTTTLRTPISGWSKTKAKLDASMKILPWRLHDLRRTAITGMAKHKYAGLPRAIIMLQFG